MAIVCEKTVMIASLARRTRPRWSQRWVSTGFNSNQYGLSSEQIQLVEMCENFSKKELLPHASEWDRDKVFPEETLRKLAELGLGGMFVSEPKGGAGFSRFDGSLVFEALAQGCTSTTAYLSIHNMCGWMVSEFGSPVLQDKYLNNLMSCEWFSSYCLTEPGSGSDAASLSTTAKRVDGGTFILNGSKAFISGGSRSDVYLVMARTGGPGPKGISCFLVDADTPGLSFGKQEDKLGWNSQPTCAVIFEDVQVSSEQMLGEEGHGFKYAMQGLDGGRLSIAACSIGAAQACYLTALEHTKIREQFGKRLIDNQSMQFSLVDMGTKIHLSRLAVRHAASLLDAKDPNSTVHCALAKKVATDYCFQVCDEAL